LTRISIHSMSKERSIHPHFQHFLDFKDKVLIDQYLDIRHYLFSISPDANELIYNTHALTSVYSLSDRLAESFCMIPIYSKHLNLGFNKGAILPDPANLLKGTGKLIRHIPITTKDDYRNQDVKTLIENAIQLELENMDMKKLKKGMTISKIKLSK